MKLRSTIILAPLLSLVTLANSRATEPASVSFRAVCFDPRETATPVLFLTHGGVRKILDIDKSRLSERQSADVRDGHLVDFHTTPDPQPGELPAITLTLAAGPIKDLLFVFAPATTGYRAWAIQTPSGEFKPGATLLVNAAPAEVAIRSGNAKPLAVLPGKSRILPLPEGFDGPMLPVQIFEKHTPTDPWQIVQSTRWAVDLRFRSYLFLYHAPGNGQLLLHGVTERLSSVP